MFNSTYFAPVYFEPHYFSQSTAELVPATGSAATTGSEWLPLLSPVIS